MLFLALILAIGASALPTTSGPDPKVVCAQPGKCLTIDTFSIVQPKDAKVGEDNVSLDFIVQNDNPDPAFQGSDQCDIDWKYGTLTWPQQLTKCRTGNFAYQLEQFQAIDKTFYIEVQQTVTVGTEVITVNARGKVDSHLIKCSIVQESFKRCELAYPNEILLVIQESKQAV